MVFEIGSGWHQKGDEKVRDRDIEYVVGRRKSGTICSHAGGQAVFEIGSEGLETTRGRKVQALWSGRTDTSDLCQTKNTDTNRNRNTNTIGGERGASKGMCDAGHQMSPSSLPIDEEKKALVDVIVDL